LADEQDTTTALWEAAADGANPHPLLPRWNTPASECCGAWTADGKFFVFESAQNGRRDIWILPENAGQRIPQQLTAGPIDFSYPAAGKNAHEILAIGSLSRAEILRYDLRERRLVPFLPGLSAEGLDFSRDGNWVTYTSYPEGLLWRSRTDGSD